MRGGQDLWKKIWTQKYSMPTSVEDILRLEEVLRGSTVWDLASQNRDIISRHAFWEIRDGNTAKFWEEAWQQRERLAGLQLLQDTYQRATTEGLHYVNEYWKEERQDETLRIWRNPEEWESNIDPEQRMVFAKEMESRRIKIRTSLDIIWWGSSAKGTFTVKEAYYLTTHQVQEEEEPGWKQIWKNKWWPKVTLFA